MQKQKRTLVHRIHRRIRVRHGVLHIGQGAIDGEVSIVDRDSMRQLMSSGVPGVAVRPAGDADARVRQQAAPSRRYRFICEGAQHGDVRFSPFGLGEGRNRVLLFLGQIPPLQCLHGAEVALGAHRTSGTHRCASGARLARDGVRSQMLCIAMAEEDHVMHGRLAQQVSLGTLRSEVLQLGFVHGQGVDLVGFLVGVNDRGEHAVLCQCGDDPSRSGGVFRRVPRGRHG